MSAPFLKLEVQAEEDAARRCIAIVVGRAPVTIIQTFTGQWPVLKGKLALFVLAQPRSAISEDTLGKSQLEFASHTFLEGYRAAVHSQEAIAGVVVVFAGDKPGVAAATLSEVRHWQEGRLSDQAFFAHCSFDPAGSFRDTAK